MKERIVYLDCNFIDVKSIGFLKRLINSRFVFHVYGKLSIKQKVLLNEFIEFYQLIKQPKPSLDWEGVQRIMEIRTKDRYFQLETIENLNNQLNIFLNDQK